MILFTLCVAEMHPDRYLTGRELHKDYTWPLVPRKGDIIEVGGIQYGVFEVIHSFDRNPATIEVSTHFSPTDFMTLSADTSWKKVFWND